MRTGAIFARGSCRALKWVALVGMVLALGAGQVAAQITVAEPPTTLTEGEATTITVEFVGDIPASSAASEVILRATAENATVSGGLMTVPLPANSSTTAEAAFAKATRTFTVTADEDADAADSNNTAVTVSFVLIEDGTLVETGTSTAVTAPSALSGLTVEDDEVQKYTLELLTRDQNLEEGKSIEYRVKAAPAFLASADPVNVDLRLTPPVSTFSGTGVTSTVKGEGVVSVGPGDDGTRTISFTVPKDDNTDDTQIVLTASWGTRAEGGDVSDSRTIVDPDDPAPSAPGAPTVTATPGNGEVTLTWMSVTGATKYQYAYALTGSTMGDWMPEAGMATMSATVANLTNGMEYTFYVRAGNDAGYGDAGMDTATPMTGVTPGVTPKSTTEIMTAVQAAQMAADSDGDGMWTPQDGPATIALTDLFEGLPEMFNAEAMSSAPHVQASILASSGLTRSSNPAVLLTPVSAGIANVTVTAAGSQAVLPAVEVMPMATGTGSIRWIASVRVGQLREGGQAQATVSLNAPVRPGNIFKAKLRLVGQMHAREAGIVTPLASPPHRTVGGVRVPLTGELTAADYDADVIGELTIQAGYSSGTVTITTGTDDDAEDERLALQAVKDGQMFTPNSDVSPHGARGEAVFTVEDAHEQGYVLTAVPSKIYESGNFTTVSTLHFTPNYVREDDDVWIRLTTSHPGYSALFTGTTSSLRQLPVGGDSVTAQFQLVPERRAGCVCDGDRMDDEVVITATANGVEVAETTVTVVDVHKLPEITVTAMTVSGAGPLMELAEGAKYTVRVEANRNKPSGEVTGETVTVSLALGDDSTAVAEDYRITPSSRRITGGLNDQSATFDLEVLGGDGDIGEETLVLDAMVKGGATHGGGTENKGMLSVTLVDTTTLNVEPRSDTEVQLAVVKARNAAEGADDLWTYGDDDLSIELGDLFKLPADGFTTTADAVSGDAKVVTAQADAGIVTVTAVGMGTTMVTVTATTAASGVQISPNIASVEFEIEVDELTRVFMVSGPDDMDMMNLVEGGEGAMVTVSTNIPVSENTEVMLMRDGSSSAGDDDYMLEPSLVTIMAGEMTGSTTVTATEDDMAEEMEMLTLFLVVDDMQMTDKSVSFYLWDAAVPALPIIAQLLLAGILGGGGYRRYRRR